MSESQSAGKKSTKSKHEGGSAQELFSLQPIIRLNKIHIANFRAIEDMTIEFAPPAFSEIPDVTVFGSLNGVGKTSVLEACVLSCGLISLGTWSTKEYPYFIEELPVDIYDLLIRSGSDEAVINAEFTISEKVFRAETRILRMGRIIQQVNKQNTKERNDSLPELVTDFDAAKRELLLAITGLSKEPFIYSPCLYFHSYRKIAEGSPELGHMLERPLQRIRPKYSIRSNFGWSSFKTSILRTLISSSGIIENISEGNDSISKDKLDELMKRYTGGIIGRPRSLPDNSLELRVELPDNTSFSFDGLSSGQKEIVSTLFQIWKATASCPGVVMLDEPELHLNAEWQTDFISQIYALAPFNQYIIATHSEYIFKSAEQYQRLMFR